MKTASQKVLVEVKGGGRSVKTEKGLNCLFLP